jgi:hypothetical protein
MSMSVRPALLPVRTMIAGWLASVALGATAAGAATIRDHVRFDPSDVRVEDGSGGPRVTMVGLTEAGGDDAPALPMAVRSYYVPDGFEVREVRVVPRSEVRIARGVRLAVREAPLEPKPEDATRSFPAGAVEAGVSLHPSRSGVSLRSGSLAGHRVHSVALFPVQWDSQSLELRVARSIDVEIELAPAPISSDLVRERPAPSADRAFCEALGGMVANAADLPAPGPDLPASSGGFRPADLPTVEGSAVDMVIVTTPVMEATFQTLADWKTKKGVPTVVRTVDWIDANYPAGHDRSERIRLFLQDAYRKWGLYLALLAGDFAEVPPRLAWNRFFFGGTEIPTDQYYAGLEGDWNADGDDLIGEGLWQAANDDQADLYPDIFVGRAPVSTAAEAATFVTKSMSYEKTPPAGYVEEVCHLAEVLFPASWEYGVNPPEDITLDGMDLTQAIDAEIDSTWQRFPFFQSMGGLDRQLALHQLNAGHHLTTLMCHGDAFKFSVGNGLNPLVYISDTDTLSNGNRQLVVMATACNPNQFDLESIGESFLNNPDGGAVVCIGPTRVDFPLSATTFHVVMANLWFSKGVTGFGASSQVNRVPFAALSGTDATPDRWTTLTKSLLGDPEIRFWTEQPPQLVVSHASSVPLGTASITVTVTDGGAQPVADALVCVSDAVGTYARARTNGAGVAALPLTSTGTGTASVVASKAEFRPEETTFTITPIGGANLALSSHDIDDDGSGASSGNGDGVIDAGETIELQVSVRNGGGASANGASVAASVEPGSSATFDLTYDGAADPAKVFIGPDRTHPGAIPFTLDFDNPVIAYTGTPPQTYSADSTSGERGIFLWQDRGGWHLRWGSGSDSVQVAGTITTDGRIRGLERLDLENGADVAVISAGEDSLTFSGWTHASDPFDGIDVALADSTMLTITTASDALGNIASSATATGTVVFDVSSSARDEQIAYVDLELTAGAGGPWSGVVPVVFAGPELDAYAFTIDDDATPPSSGDGDGVVEVGETVVLTPTVLNRGSGAAESVDGVASASSGITFLDAADAYGSIPSLVQTAGTNGYRFTVDNGAGTTIDLTLTDSLGRTWAKPIEFVRPAAPSGLAFESTSSSIELHWSPNGELDLAGYNVYRSTTSGSGFTQLSFELIRSGSRYADEDLAFGASFYYRVTAVDNSGNESLASSEVFGWTTLPQSPGWPKFSTSNIFSSPGIVDADGDGQSELYVGSQDFGFHAWKHDGDDIPGFPVLTNGPIWGTPGFGDVNKDGDEEIFFASLDSKFYAVHHDSTPVYGSTPDFFLFDDLQGARGSVAIADVDHDAQLEIIIGTDWGRLFAFDHDGTAMNGSNPLLFSVSPLGTNSRIWGTIAVGDIDNDGTREIGFCSWNDSLYVIEPDGTLEPGFPKGGTLNYRSGPVFADLDADGTKEVIAGNDDGRLYAYNHDGSNYATGGILATMPLDIRSVPAVANIDGDPQLEIFVTCMDGNLYGFQHDGVGILNPNGLFVDIEPTASGFSASPIVVDVDGDSDMEILVGHRNGNFYGFHHDGTGIVGMPIPTANEIYSTAAAGDLDGDGFIDVAFASYDGSVNVIDFPGPSTPAAYEWPTYAGNNYRTSTYGEPGPWQTGVDLEASGTRLAFALLQNSPNPFLAGTSIGYVVPEDGRVTLRIYDVSGRLVRTLVHGTVPAGRNTAVWDGRDGDGQRLASGVYFYRLETADRSLTKKSLLLR